VNLRKQVNPMYFGSAGGSLFGCYHPPMSREIRRCGVLLCYPMGHEYIRSHRAYRTLAVRLSRQGFPSFRFDYCGSGDSEGDHSDVRFDDWLDDVRAAAEHFKDLCGCERLVLVGLRMGGTVGMIVGARENIFDKMVLWHPVLAGARYLGELESSNLSYLEDRRQTHHHRSLTTEGNEIVESMGFEYSRALRQDLEALDLLEVTSRPAQRVLLLDNSEAEEQLDLKLHLERIGVAVDYQRHLDPGIWLAEPFKMLLPHQSVGAIVAWLSEVES